MSPLTRNRLICVAGALLFLLPTALFAAGQSDTAAAADNDEFMEITWLARLEAGTDTTWCIDEIERKFNARIIPNGIDTNDGEKVNVMLAAGEFPDVGAVFADRIKLFYEGVNRAIPKQMLIEYAPGYTKRLNEDYPLGWLAARNPDNPEEYLGMLGIRDNADTNVWYVAFRADWAEKVGVELPNYAEKKIPLDRFGRVYFLDENVSLEWLENLLEAFRDGDPDGNGKNDTIPWGGFKYGGNWTFQPILGAFGLARGFNVMVDGKLYDYAIAPPYKEFLKVAQRWYAKGLIDKEYANLDLGKGWEKVKNGMIGAENVIIWYTGVSWAMGYPANTFASDEEVAAGAEVVLIPPPVGPGGKQGAGAYWPVSAIGSNWISIGSQVSDAKLARALQILDWMRYGDKEGWVAAAAGLEGVHFDWEGEAWASMPIPRKAEDVPAGYPKVGLFPSFYPICYTKDRFPFQYPKHLADFYNDYLLADRGQQLTIRPHRNDFANETNLQQVNQDYGGALNTIRDEFYNNAIIGEVDIDAEWDAYVKKWLDSGGQKVMDELNKAPLVSGLREGEFQY